VITGTGDSVQESQDDFCTSVHAAFQDLVHRRPFEMSVNDKLVWETLNGIIDVTVYRNTTPIVVRQFGRICKARPYPSEVQWEDGRRESMTLSDVAEPDYVTYCPGQPFEAIVHRDPLTSRLVRVVHIRRCSAPKRLLPAEERAILADAGSAKKLEPDSQWRP
jgi:hypothetical protein